jgi:hypothetical protein
MFWLLARYKPFGDYPSQSAGKYKSTRQGWSIILQNNISHSARLMKPTSQTLIKALLISSKFAKILNFIILPHLKPLGCLHFFLSLVEYFLSPLVTGFLEVGLALLVFWPTRPSAVLCFFIMALLEVCVAISVVSIRSFGSILQNFSPRFLITLVEMDGGSSSHPK